jgi:aerobic-type carbon monoxide dehydrogenase small subunit (CoxS/CutS family)
MASSKGPLRLQINGRARRVPGPSRPLLTVLRDELGLTGAKYGCGAGQCGACTVLVDGKATRACITEIESLDGKAVTTIEGLERRGALHPLQEAFIAAGAMQCGYCVPGMIMSALALLERQPDPDEAEIRRALQGNICRCGAYPRYVTAVKQAAAAARTKVQR